MRSQSGRDWAPWRACPPQMRSPAMSSQGFIGCHLLWLTSSRHRGACRPVLAGFRVALSVVSSIDLRSIHDFTRATRVTSFIVCSGSSARDNPQTSRRGWSLPVRLRCARKTGRAQQRNTNAATGSSAFGLRIHPEPNRRSAFSQRLSLVAVKAYRVPYR